MKIRIERVRGAFLNLHEPRLQMNSDVEKYDGNFILGPKSRVVIINADKTTTVSTIDKVLEIIVTDKWKAKGPQILAAIEDSKKFLRDGDNKLTKGGEIYDGFEGSQYVVAKNPRQPRLLNQARVELKTPRDVLNLMYAGAYYDIVIDAYALDKTGQGKSVNATLLGVQFREDGDAFGGGAPAGTDDFEDLGTAADDASDLT